MDELFKWLMVAVVLTIGGCVIKAKMDSNARDAAVAACIDRNGGIHADDCRKDPDFALTNVESVKPAD